MARCVLSYHQCLLLLHLATRSSDDVTHASEVDSTPLSKHAVLKWYLLMWVISRISHTMLNGNGMHTKHAGPKCVSRSGTFDAQFGKGKYNTYLRYV